jgi:2-hydroxy-3-keto-5-methylthiopentenyl-1-phosphate phosphatase
MEFEPIRAEHDEVVAEAVAATRVRAGFAPFVHAARAAGRRIVVVSSGFRSIIEPVLEREGVGDLELFANEVRFSAEGTTVSFRSGERCGDCGEECKRATVRALDGDGPIAYVGDGYSDRCAALTADTRVATSSLARYLEGLGEAFSAFHDFHDVRRILLGDA